MNYYSYKYSDVLELNVSLFLTLLESMRIVKSRERLLKMEEISYPHMKDQDRKELHKKTYRESYPESFNQKVNEIRMGDLPRILGGSYGH